MKDPKGLAFGCTEWCKSERFGRRPAGHTYLGCFYSGLAGMEILKYVNFHGGNQIISIPARRKSVSIENSEICVEIGGFWKLC
jgi:hypothetical protein